MQEIWKDIPNYEGKKKTHHNYRWEYESEVV